MNIYYTVILVISVALKYVYFQVAWLFAAWLGTGHK